MEKKIDYDKNLRKAKQLKFQIIAVILIIIFTLGSGTVFAAVMFNPNSHARKAMNTKVQAMSKGPEYDCFVICPKCGKSHGYCYIPKNRNSYYCVKCGTNLEHGKIIINQET